MNIKSLFIFAAAVLLISCGISIYHYLYSEKTAYVNMEEVYNSFPLKASFEKELLAFRKEREKVLDSLNLQLRSLGLSIESGVKKDQASINLFQLMRQDLMEKQELFTEQNEAQADSYKSQIWKQLREYINEYGDNQSYDYIYGVDEGYQFLYFNKTKDITKDVSNYVNNRYSGK